MNERDEIRLRDMLDMAYAARRFAAGRSREDLDTNEMLTFALIRALEVIGEAASRVTPETRQALSQIDWKEIIGMRNRIIHDYTAVNIDIVWGTVMSDVPILITQLERIFPASDAESPGE